MPNVQISRDPFARTTLVRRVVRLNPNMPPKCCFECGGLNSHLNLFEYGTENDGLTASYIGPHWHKGLFCSKGCHDAYHA